MDPLAKYKLDQNNDNQTKKYPLKNIFEKVEDPYFIGSRTSAIFKYLLPEQAKRYHDNLGELMGDFPMASFNTKNQKELQTLKQDLRNLQEHEFNYRLEYAGDENDHELTLSVINHPPLEKFIKDNPNFQNLLKKNFNQHKANLGREDQSYEDYVKEMGYLVKSQFRKDQDWKRHSNEEIIKKLKLL